MKQFYKEKYALSYCSQYGIDVDSVQGKAVINAFVVGLDIGLRHTENYIKNAEINCIVTALSLLREIYTNAEISDDGGVILTAVANDWEALFTKILTQIGMMERVLASNLKGED